MLKQTASLICPLYRLGTRTILIQRLVVRFQELLTSSAPGALNNEKIKYLKNGLAFEQSSTNNSPGIDPVVILSFHELSPHCFPFQLFALRLEHDQ